MAFNPLGHYSTIYDIPTSGKDYKNLTFRTESGMKRTDPITGESRVVSGRGATWSSSKDPKTGKKAAYIYEPMGTYYAVTYTDAEGDTHKASLDTFLKKDFMRGISIGELPAGHAEYMAGRSDPNADASSYKPPSVFTTNVGGFENVNSPRGTSQVPGQQITSTVKGTSRFLADGSSTPSLTLENLLKDSRVANDKGVNGTTMAKWLEGNASLLPKLSSLGYTTTDLINEAYSQTRYDRSAFSGDMTTMTADDNRALNQQTGYNPAVAASGNYEGQNGSYVDNGLNISNPEDGLTQAQKDMIDKLNSDIDNWEGLSIEQKAILKEIAAGDYTSGQKIPTTEELNQIIQDAATNAETDLSPYYEKQTGRQLEDLKNAMADIRNESARYAQQESLAYKEKLAQTKATLRARGLTFSGTPKAELGTEGFTKANMEGSLQQARRYDWEDKRSGWQETARDLGTLAERNLGSGKVDSQDYGKIIDPYSNGFRYDANSKTSLFDPHKQGQDGYVATGDLALDRLKEIENSKWDRISKYRANI